MSNWQEQQKQVATGVTDGSRKTPQTEALKLALEALETYHGYMEPLLTVFGGPRVPAEQSTTYKVERAITAIKEALAQPEQPKVRTSDCLLVGVCASEGHKIQKAQLEQEPVAMKFKIYKPTVPDPVRQGINNALLPWVYDQDRSSGFDASMWVTPVATLTPQRKPLTDEEIGAILEGVNAYGTRLYTFARAIEAKLKEKNT